MTNLQKLLLEQSELREKVNAILGDDERGDEERAELAKHTARLQELEPELRAAIVANQAAENEAEVETRLGANGDGEKAETRRLLEKANVVRFAQSALTGTALPTELRELNESLDAPERMADGGVLIPWQALEVRADAVVDTTNLTGPTAMRPILPRLFGRDILADLGVRLDNAMGVTAWPIMTAGATAEQTSEGAAIDADAASFTRQELKPRRLTARYRWTVEMDAEIGNDLERALRMDITSAMRSAMSKQVIDGNGTAPNVTGLFQRLSRPARGSTYDYQAFAGTATSAVDGIHADAEGQVSVVCSVDFYTTAAGVYRDGTAETALQALSARARSVRATSFIPNGPTTGGASGRQDEAQVILHGGNDRRGDSVAAMFSRGVVAIRDPYTAAAEGETILTLYQLWDCYTALRQGAYKRLSVLLK